MLVSWRVSLGSFCSTSLLSKSSFQPLHIMCFAWYCLNLEDVGLVGHVCDKSTYINEAFQIVVSNNIAIPCHTLQLMFFSISKSTDYMCTATDQTHEPTHTLTHTHPLCFGLIPKSGLLDTTQHPNLSTPPRLTIQNQNVFCWCFMFKATLLRNILLMFAANVSNSLVWKP